MRNPGCHRLALLLLSATLLVPARARAVDRSGFTKQECAICHITWLDVFHPEDTPLIHEGWKPARIEETLAVVSGDDMCYSCHDGFVRDSRKRVWEGRGHSVGKKPSANVPVPSSMPLDKKGEIYCGTCHTPHAVGEQTAELTGSFFLRTENVDSKLCTQCHVRSSKDPGKTNHPVNVLQKEPVSQEVRRLGGRLGSDQRRIICQSCHMPHGNDTLLKPVKDSSLCLICHEELNQQGPFLQEGRPFHPSGRIPKKEILGARVFFNGAKLGEEGQIICLTCHGVHSGLGPSMIVDPEPASFCQGCHPEVEKRVAAGKHNLLKTAPLSKNSKGELPGESGVCRSCHRAHGWARTGPAQTDNVTTLCVSCHREGEIARKKGIGRFSHPVDTDMAPLQPQSPLRPVEKQGKKKVVCITCHQPHEDTLLASARSAGTATVETNAFLREDRKTLCRECHLDRFHMAGTKHDFTRPSQMQRIEKVFGKPTEGDPCTPCHLVHNAKGPGLWFVSLPEATNSFEQDEGSRRCLTCHSHETLGRIQEENGHPIGKPMKTEYLTSDEDRRKLGRIAKDDAGIQDVVVCATCHLNHGVENRDGTVSLFAGGGLPEGELCITCHRYNRQIVGSPHDFRTRREGTFQPDGGRSRKYGVCAGCHANHNASIDQGLIAFSVSPPKGEGNPEDMFCLHCHLDPRIEKDRRLKFYVHPSASDVREEMRERWNKGKKPLGDRLGNPESTSLAGYEALFHIRCITCHDNHRWTVASSEEAGELRKTEMTNFLRGSEVAENVCANCHGIEALYRYRYYHQDRAFRLKIPNK